MSRLRKYIETDDRLAVANCRGRSGEGWGVMEKGPGSLYEVMKMFYD